MMIRIHDAISSYRSYLKKRSQDYMQYGRYMAKKVEKEDLNLRFISFMGDITMMFLPIILWDYLFLLTVAHYFPYSWFHFLRYFILVLLFFSFFAGNIYLMCNYKGQSLGKLAMNFKLVDLENKELNNAILIKRELLGKALPILVFSSPFIVFHKSFLWGLLIFTLINGAFVLVDKQHRSIIDRFLKIKIVKLSEDGKKIDYHPVIEKVKEEKVVVAENRYDLHLYSSFSHDGEIAVEDLFKQAKEAGIKAISICDHNSCKANSIAKKVAPLYGIDYIPGINIDCDYKGSHVRILGYFIEGNEDRFMQIEYENLAKEKAVSVRRIQLFEDFTGFYVNSEKLLRNNRFQIITKEMIARHILSNTEYRRSKLLQPYLVGSKKDKPITYFCEDFFGKKGACYVPVVHPKAEDMIALIKSSKGVPVLAHPMYSLGNEEEKLLELLEEGMEGIEIFSPYHSHDDMKKLILLAKQKHLEVTAGSEYHGPHRPRFVLGKTGCPKDVESVIEKFISKHS